MVENRAGVRESGAALRVTLTLLSALILCCSGPSGSAPPLARLVPEDLEERPLVLGRVSRPGFTSPVGRQFSLRFTAPRERTKLWLGCGVGEDAGSVTFRAVLRCVGASSQIILDRVATPGRWIDASVDLGPYAGRQVELLLESESRDLGDTESVYWATPKAVTQTGRGPNILLICIDSLRADHLGCYGYARDTSPSLDSLAAVGCLFTRAIAQSSWTLPSHASLFTSLYVRSHRVYSKDTVLKPTAPTLAALLREHGYLTAGFVTAPSLVPLYGLDHGFDLYDARCSAPEDGEITSVVTNPCVHSRATEWLRRWGDSRFFLFLHYWDVHYDYIPPPPYDTLFSPDYRGNLTGRDYAGNDRVRAGMPREDLEHLVALYDGEIAFTDLYMQMLFHEMRQLGLHENTLVIVTSDHGDEFLEHGGKSHGHTLFQELIHVPLIWADPARRPGREVLEDPVQLIDVPPSILEFLNLEVPREMEGRSFIPALGGKPLALEPVFSELRESLGPPDRLRAAVMGDAKIIHSRMHGWTRTYDLDRDPQESRPLPARDVGHGVTLQEALASHAAEERPTLDFRVVGTGPRRCLLLRLTTAEPLRHVEPIGIEEEDSVVVARGKRLVTVRFRSPPGDLDGLRLHLPSDTTAVTVNVRLEGKRLDPGSIILGAARRPESVPFLVRSAEECLRDRPRLPVPDELDGPTVYVWSAEPAARTYAFTRDELDHELQRQLRALGYLR